MTALVIISGIVLFLMFLMLALRKPASYDSDTTVGRNGISYHRDKNAYTRNN